MTTEAGEGAALGDERKWLDQIRMLAQQPNGPVTGRWPQRLGEAVAEIDRLRAALTASERNAKLAAEENEQARLLLDAERHNLAAADRDLNRAVVERASFGALLAAQQAENERLRATMREAMDHIDFWCRGDTRPMPATSLPELKAMAGKALLSGGEEPSRTAGSAASDAARVNQICDQMIGRGMSILNAEWLRDCFAAAERTNTQLHATIEAHAIQLNSVMERQEERLNARITALEAALREIEERAKFHYQHNSDLSVARIGSVASSALLSGSAEEASNGATQ